VSIAESSQVLKRLASGLITMRHFDDVVLKVMQVALARARELEVGDKVAAGVAA
jgi:hypothetical protein